MVGDMAAAHQVLAFAVKRETSRWVVEPDMSGVLSQVCHRSSWDAVGVKVSRVHGGLFVSPSLRAHVFFRFVSYPCEELETSAEREGDRKQERTHKH